MMDLEAMKTKVQAEIDKYQDEFWQTAEYIHANPELRFEEFKAAKALCDLLENHGFEVQRGYCELPTAFRAVKEGKSGGPTIGLLCEYDALVEIGHACGHNLIGTISAAAGIAVSSILEEVCGKIVVLGTPAEEGGGGKVLILNRGGMDDLDCAMIIHPTDKTMVDDVSLANSEITFRFTGKSAHAAAYPQEGVNALEAVIATFNNINGHPPQSAQRRQRPRHHHQGWHRDQYHHRKRRVYVQRPGDETLRAQRRFGKGEKLRPRRSALYRLQPGDGDERRPQL